MSEDEGITVTLPRGVWLQVISAVNNQSWHLCKRIGRLSHEGRPCDRDVASRDRLLTFSETINTSLAHGRSVV